MYIEIMSKKPFDAQQELVNSEAKKRGEKIDQVAAQFLDILVKEEMTVNDMQVILNQLTQQLQVVFLSHQVKEFAPEKK